MRGAALAALALVLPLAPAMAQGGGFQLRPGEPGPTARPAGPADPDAPILTAPRGPTRPSPTPSPQPAPSAAPSIAASPVARPPAASPSPQFRPAQPVARPLATPAQPVTQAPAASLPSAPDALPPAIASEPVPATSGPAALPAPEAPALTEPAGFDWAAILPWLGGTLALALAGLGGFVWWRRRANADPVVEFERPLPQAEPAPPAGPEAETAPDLEELVLGTEQVVADLAQGPLALSLSATRMSATLLNTTLQYKIELTNRADAAIGPLTVAGDMISAHASLPVERQLGLEGARLEQRHEVPSLAPGESATLSGEIRLPLAEITPILSGDAAFFVPLARFRVEAARVGADMLSLVRTFVVGETPEQAGAALRPFRLDLGPRVYSRLGQREIAQPA